MDIKKTNAARILDRQKISYELIPYKVDENDLGAQHVADSYLQRLHETSDDWIPLWDMDDPRGAEKAPKDASAACVVASALLELAGFSKEDKGSQYKDAAIEMLTDLSTEKYQSGARNVSFLMHSVGNLPAGSEIDACIVYADYYYLEALMRLKKSN